VANKLRGLSVGGGAFLVGAAAWTAASYGATANRATFVGVALLGIGVAAAPRALATGKLWSYRLRRAREAGGADGPDRDATYVSADPIRDPDDALGAVAAVVRDSDEYDGVRDEQFPEGVGLTITHVGFHNSFVRITDADRMVVSGASERTRSLARDAGDALGVSLEPASSNPFRGPRPVRGAPRVFLGVLLVALVVVGAIGLGGAAYPSDAYNPAEKSVLVAVDARADVDPGFSDAEARLAKAAFLADVLDEEAVEIRWDGDDRRSILAHGRQALRIREDARELLEPVRDGAPYRARERRAARIAADLREAERRVAVAINERTNATEAEASNATELFRIRRALAPADNTTAGVIGAGPAPSQSALTPDRSGR
jgi:hypothetical protein